MKFFRALSKRGLADLITCIVQKTGDSWEVSWVSEGRAPAGYYSETLTAATDQAAAEVAELYTGRIEATNAELMFAIYPWGGDGGKAILDISQDADGFVARDIQGSAPATHGGSLEALVEDAERSLPDTAGAMFRWIRKVTTIPASNA